MHEFKTHVSLLCLTQVTIVAAAEGRFELPQIKNASDLREALTLLGSIPSDQLQVSNSFNVDI